MVTTKNIISVKAKILGLAEAYDLWQQYVVCKSWASMLIQAQLKLLQGNLYDKDKKVFFFIWYSHTTLSLTAERLECLIPAPGVMRSNPAVSGEISRKLYIGGWIYQSALWRRLAQCFDFDTHTQLLWEIGFPTAVGQHLCQVYSRGIFSWVLTNFTPSLLPRYLFLGTDSVLLSDLRGNAPITAWWDTSKTIVNNLSLFLKTST